MRQLITILFFGITLAGAQQPATRFTNTYRNQINAFVQEHINRLSADIQKNEKLFDQITAPCGGKSQTVNPDVKKRFLEELNARIRNDLELIFANASVAEKRFTGRPESQVYKDAQVFISSRIMANEINRLVIGFCNLTPPVSKNNPPVANAGKDIVISLPENAVQLNGQVSDPDEESLIIQWSKLTGPANDIVISPNSAVASVQNLRQGVYQYVLSVRDKAGAFDADTVRVIVNQPKPKPPVADAGMNIVISLPQSTVTLDGSGSQPNDNTLSYFWEKLGDISPNIQLLNHRTVKPGITGLTAGKYEFTLTVQNKMEQVDRDTVMIIVNQPPRKPNNKPSASAGKDQKITLPDNSITLNGSARDPDNDPLVIEWKQVSGPVQAEMNSRDSFTPKVIFFQEGVYEFMLTVADPYGASATDRVIITVKQRALVFINNPPVADAGPDQQLVLGKDKLVLTGKGYDQDPQGYIVSYRWDKLDRVDSVRILSRFDSITAVDRIDTGLHQFQLTVRDNFGKSATDTVMIRIVAPSPGGSAWVWIMLGTGLLAIASTLYILWWRRQPEKIIVYFINKAEEELAHAMVPDAKSTDGYVVGHSTRSNIREMKKKGLPLLLLNRKVLTVYTPGITKTYTFSFKKGDASLKSVAETTHEGEFHNLIATMPVQTEVLDPLPSFYMITLDDPLLPVYKERLAGAGLTVIQKIPVNSYILLVKDQNQLNQLQDKTSFDFIRMVTPYTAIDTGFFLRKDHVRPEGTLENSWVLDLVLHREEDGATVRGFLESNKIEINGYYRNIIRIRIRPDTTTAQLLSSNKYIQAIYEHIPPVLHNDIARQLIGIDAVAAGETWFTETGDGEIIAVADTGIDGNHPDLQGKLIGAVAWGRSDSDTSDPHGHGTHVTGSITGNGHASGGKIRGMATGAKIFFQSLLDENGLLCDLELKLPDLLQQAYDNGARILNISWGASTESYYTFDAVAMDQFIYDHPDMLVLVSAGNEAVKRTDANGNEVVAFGSVGSPATTKNGLTVGASRSSRMQEDPEAIAAFSSRGPCKSDRRIKPDIVAPGTDILSTKSGTAPDRNFDRFYDNPAYVFMGGTSMATPVVSGAAALVREYYRQQKGNAQPGAALVKATLINGTKQLMADSAMRGSDIIPNNNQGYGLLDMSMTIPNSHHPFQLHYFDSGTDPSLLFQQPGERRQFCLVLQQQTWVRACLVFIDNPALGGVQSDLDLIIARDGTVSKWTGNAGINAKDPLLADIQNDFTNNIEVVRITEAEPAAYTIEVVATNMAPKGNLRYALVITTGDTDAIFSMVNP